MAAQMIHYRLHSSSTGTKRTGDELQHSSAAQRQRHLHHTEAAVVPIVTPTTDELIRTGIFLTVSTGSMLVAKFQPECTRSYWKSFRKPSLKDGSQAMFCTGAYDAIKERVRENPDHTKRDLRAVTGRIGCGSQVNAFDGVFMNDDNGSEDPCYIFDKDARCSPDCVWNRFTVKGDPDKHFVDETASRLVLQSQLFMSDGTMEKKKNAVDGWKHLYRKYVKLCKTYAANLPALNVLRILINKLPDLGQLDLDGNEDLGQYWAFIEYISTSSYDGYLADDVYMTNIVKRGIKGLENQMRFLESWTPKM